MVSRRPCGYNCHEVQPSLTTPTSIRRLARPLALLLIFAAPIAARAQSAAGAASPGAARPSNLPDAPSPQPPSTTSATLAYEPITPGQRLDWVFWNTLGPHHVLGNAILAAYDTALNEPREYGPHVEGFADRLGIRVAGTAVSDTMEASLGMIWGEDPRYLREPEKSFKGRLTSVFEQTFMTRRRAGNFEPAYARFLAIPGSNFLSNTWRARSEADTGDALVRTGEGFAGQMASNTWDEFWPDIKQKVFHHGSPAQ